MSLFPRNNVFGQAPGNGGKYSSGSQAWTVTNSRAGADGLRAGAGGGGWSVGGRGVGIGGGRTLVGRGAQ